MAPQYLTQRRQKIGRIYDDHYSIPPARLTRLLSGGRLVEDELRGLGEDKLGQIQRGSSISLNGDPQPFDGVKMAHWLSGTGLHKICAELLSKRIAGTGKLLRGQ